MFYRVLVCLYTKVEGLSAQRLQTMTLSASPINPAVLWLSNEQNIVLLLLDTTNSIIASSQNAQHILGFSQQELLKADLNGLGLRNDARLSELLSQPTGPSRFSCQVPVTCADGQQRGCVARAFRLSDGSHFLSLEPIGDQSPSVAKIREDEERYRLALEAAGIGTWDMDIARNETRRALLHDQCFGYQDLQESWGYHTFLSHIVEQDRERVDRAYRNAMKGGDEYDIRFRVNWPDGSVHWLWSKGRFYLDESGNPSRVAGIQADVTEEVMLREQLRYKATHDYLTGLWNRDFFETNLKKLLETCARDGSGAVVLMVDIDHFKRFNDAFNHAGGDQVLKSVAERLRATRPDSGLIARFGGDEFVLAAVNEPGQDSLDDWVGRLIESVSAPLDLDQGRVKPTVSVGVALFPEHGRHAQDLLKAADSAMYEAKRCGRATFKLFDAGVHQARLDALMLADRLPEALAAGELQLYYQPQFEVAEQRLVGMEALLRWFPANRPPVPPDIFVRAAEQSGFISVLGDWVIREACRQIREWQDLGFKTVPVALNVSSLQFARGELVRSIRHHLDAFRLAGHCLELEITESIAVDNLDNALAQLHEIRGLGLGISMDDFGTGFSSLSYLRFFPIDRIKVDRAFVTDCLNIKENAAICRAVIVLAHSLGCRVVAEGVEYPEQLNFLVQQGCEEVQGYLFSRPLSAVETARFLQRERPPAGRPEQTGTVLAVEQGVQGALSAEVDDADESLRQRSVCATKSAIARNIDRYRSIVEMAARAINVPMAALNVMERHCVTTVVPYGLEGGSFERSTAFCNQTVRQSEVLAIDDASTHPFFRRNPAVAGAPGIRFYAGFGLLAPPHQVVGTLCLFDTRPRQLTDLEKGLIAHFGAMIEELLAQQTEGVDPVFASVHPKRDFPGHLRNSWRLASRTGSHVAMIWLGIDDLKRINVFHGIEAGDACIRRVITAVSLEISTRNGFEAFRMEGDTVAVCCVNTSLAEARRWVTAIRQRLEAPEQGSGASVPFAVSLGVHAAASDGTVAGLENFLRDSRRALEQAKVLDGAKIRVPPTLNVEGRSIDD